ncbi:MAG: DeoR/GlpR family DNA-binding transcription regulator [Actinomycetia bacterium]|nr:DeoR/GlpR family DNA-binding transcription regulator [Actinomycetes bacterium]
MLASERQARILDLLATRRFASADDLAGELGASIETIRRDIRTLDKRQALHRVRGGALAAASVAGEPVFEDRSMRHQEAKQAIAALAAKLVDPGQTVFLDLGTTAVQVARALASSFVGNVATTSLLVAGELAGLRGIDVLVCGGRVRGGDLACWNAQAVGFFAGIHADVAFVGSGGVDASAGLTDYHLEEVATRRQMIANARRSYMLADASKFGVAAPYSVCSLDQIHGLISEVPPPPDLSDAITREGGQIISG